MGRPGKPGRHVLEQALAGGYEVHAVARRPESVLVKHENLTVVGGDVLTPDTWANQLAGVDAVISALGVGMQRAPTTAYSAGADGILTAMTDHRELAIQSGGNIDVSRS